MNRVTTLDMEAAGDAAKELRQRFLEQHGWKYTCKNPGALWLWEMAMEDGRVILAETALAVTISEYIDTQLVWTSKHDFGEDGECVRCDISCDEFERGGFKAECKAASEDDHD